ncbi:enoyl-CoA hydratase/isomerase family protein [Streptomyces sp. NPDC055092]
MVSPARLAEGLGAFGLDREGRPGQPLVHVDLDGCSALASGVVDAAVAAAAEARHILVGVASRPLEQEGLRLAATLSLSLVPPAPPGQSVARSCIAAADPTRTAMSLATSVLATPMAATTLTGLLRLTEQLPVTDGLFAESLAYSTLLAGPEFAAWRQSTPRRPVPVGTPDDPPVVLVREEGLLRITLNRPRRHNAFSSELRDGLLEALDLARWDPTLTAVELTGRGRSFCSGGDLDEFGTAPDPAAAHLIRTRQSVARAIDRVGARVRTLVHGACIGAGIELPSFGARLEARPGTYFQLPELRMGLIPGAGGTVGITRRIGRWRTAYMALSGNPVDVPTALEWGLVDAALTDDAPREPGDPTHESVHLVGRIGWSNALTEGEKRGD